MFDIKEWYRLVAQNSIDFYDYWQNASRGLSLLCMGLGRIPDSAGYDNFIRAWENK